MSPGSSLLGMGAQDWCWLAGEPGCVLVLVSWRRDCTASLASPSVLMVRCTPRDLPPASTPPAGVPGPPALQEALRDQLVALTWLLSDCCFCLSLKGREILCVPFKNGVCFSQPSGTPEQKPGWPSKPKCSGGSSSWCWTPWPGVSDVRCDLLAPWGEPLQL